ncbi:Zn-dependent hydrolase [Sporosarcina limicola]|uniref:N-carbamoyl-L-amino-acid hydrolase n=1 Tax=Sporosarcina limicola TaxID=34101 RepID=A0A927MK12_9BACL|nr:Zn-dependent hydrolase [Sporosarcina limicola]MBE1552999.1 N-carbamoyl-L-amino-acid hydrolase [Sporosarcina limicola]
MTMTHYFDLNTDRIQNDILTLAGMINEEAEGYTRRPFTKWYAQSRAWLAEEMRKCGLAVQIDASSNLIGRLEGINKSLPPLMIGSHTDTVTGGGRFDGIIGVLAGIEIVRQLSEKNMALDHTLLIVDFTAEEPSEFGISTIGSRGMVNNLSTEMLSRKDPDGLVLSEGIKLAGGRPKDIPVEALQKGDLSLYLELHIEQGPVLEQTNTDLGIVTGIVGIQRYRIEVVGQANHAGTTPMNMRFDALTAASTLLLAIESIANQQYEELVVGTVGRLFNEPNGSNVIPGRVIFDVELRSLSTNAVDQMVNQIKEEITIVESNRSVNIVMDKLSQSDPIIVDQEVVNGIEKSCSKIGKTTHLPSGAGHDANQIARISPIGMIFVPSKDGKSHCPEEFTEYEQVAKGVQALGNALLHFDQVLVNPTTCPQH